jgi:hypothetical protein
MYKILLILIIIFGIKIQAQSAVTTLLVDEPGLFTWEATNVGSAVSDGYAEIPAVL